MSQPVQEQQPPRRRSPSPASRHYVPILFTRDDFPNVYRPIGHRHDPPTTPAGPGDYRHVPLSSRMAPGGTTPASSLVDAIKASPMTNSSPTLLSRIRTPPQREQRDRDRNNIHISNNNSNTRLPPRPGFALPAARMEHPLPERPRATWNDTPPRSTFRKVERDTYRPPPPPPPPPHSNSQGYDSYRPSYDSDYSHYSNHNRYNDHYNPRHYSHYSPRAPLSPLNRSRYYDRRLPKSSRSDNSRSRSRSRSRSLSRSRSRSSSRSRSRSPRATTTIGRRYRPPTRSRSKSPRSRSRSRSRSRVRSLKMRSRSRSRSMPRSLRSRIRSRSRSRPRLLKSRLRSRSSRSRRRSRSSSRSRSRPRSLRPRSPVSRSRSRSRLRGRSPSRVRMRMRRRTRSRSRSRSRGRGRESPSRSRSRSRRRYTPPRGGDFYRSYSYSRRISRSKSRGRSRSSSRGWRRPQSSGPSGAIPRSVSSPRSVSRSRSSIASSRASSVNIRSLLERVGRGQEAICSSKHDTTVLLPISDDIPSLASVVLHPPPEDVVMNPSPATPPSLASQALHALQALQALQTPQPHLHTPHTPIISPQPQLLLSPFSPVNQLDDDHHHLLFQQSAEDVRPSPLSPSPASSPIGSPVQMEVDVDVDVRMRVEVGDSVRVESDEVLPVEEEEEERDVQKEKNQDEQEQVQIPPRAPSEESVVEIVADSRFTVQGQQEPEPEPQAVVVNGLDEPEEEKEVEAAQPSSPVIIVEDLTSDIEEATVKDAFVVAQADVLFELGLEPTTQPTTGWSDTRSPSPPPLPPLPSPSPPPSASTPIVTVQQQVEKPTPKPVPPPSLPVTRSTPFLPPPPPPAPPVIPETPVQEPKEITIKDIPSLADAKSTAEVLRIVVMRRHFCDTQTREERVNPVLKSNLSISEEAARPSTSVHQLISEVCDGKRHLDRLAAFTTGIRSVLAKQLSDREAERVARIQKLQKEYAALHQKWVQHCALLDEQSRALTSEVEVVQPAGRTTRRSAATMGDAVRSDLEMEQIIASLGNDEATDPAHLSLKNLATIPDMVSVTHGKVDYVYDDTNHLVENPAEYYGPQSGTHDWTEEEKKTFLDKFAEYPKQFGVIAEFLPSKTTRQCVAFYYLHKKMIDFRKVVSQYAPNKRKKRGTGRKKGIIADIQQHDAEVSSSGGGRGRAGSGAASSEAAGVDLLTVPSRASKGRRAEGGGKKGGRRTAIIQQQEGTPLSTPTPEPENSTNVMKIDTGTTSHATGTSSSATTTTTNATSATRSNNRRKRRQQTGNKGGENEDTADKGADSQRPTKRVKRSRIKSASIILEEPSSPVEESSTVSTPVPPSASAMVVDSASAKGQEQSETTTTSNNRRRNTSVTPVQWSEEDKNLFLSLLARHGDDFKRIAASMPNKTMVQVKEFYKSNLVELDLESVVDEADFRRMIRSSRHRSSSSVPVVDQQQETQPPMDDNNENGEGSESIHEKASSLSAAVLAENQRPMYAIPTEGWLNKPDPRHYTEDGNQTLSMRFKPRETAVKLPDPPKVPPLLPNKPALPRLLTDHHPPERGERAKCIQKKTTALTPYWASWLGSVNGTSDSSRSLVKDHAYNPLAERTSSAWEQPVRVSLSNLSRGRGQSSSSAMSPTMATTQMGSSTESVRVLADLDAEAPVSACRTRITRMLDPVYSTTPPPQPPPQSQPPQSSLSPPPVITSSRVIQPTYSTTSPPPPPQSPPSPPVMSSRRRLMSVAALTGADDATVYHPYPVLSSSQTASTTVPSARFYS